MTEDEARGWIERHHGVDAVHRVATFLASVVAENREQNLVSPASIPAIWSRHAVDSAQLLRLAPQGWRRWLDIGTGGGFPGMIVALLAPDRAITMVEPRRRRADFLMRTATELGLGMARVTMSKVEGVETKVDVISARAVGPIENLLRSAEHCANISTTWLLPRGRSGLQELATLSEKAVYTFHVEHSATDPASLIVVARRTMQ